MKNFPLHMVSMWLVLIGALNWGLVGLLNWNLVSMVFGSMPVVERVVYLLVGVAALNLLMQHMSDKKFWKM